MSPTQRSLAFCREQGWAYAIASWWNHFSKRRADLCGVIDYVVFDRAGGGPLGVQFTDETSVSKRIEKARESVLLAEWLSAPARFEVWAWGKRGAAGKKKVWTLRREAVSLAAATVTLTPDFAQAMNVLSPHPLRAQKPRRLPRLDLGGANI